jgi:hypothetical protein
MQAIRNTCTAPNRVRLQCRCRASWTGQPIDGTTPLRFGCHDLRRRDIGPNARHVRAALRADQLRRSAGRADFAAVLQLAIAAVGGAADRQLEAPDDARTGSDRFDVLSQLSRHQNEALFSYASRALLLACNVLLTN